MRGSPNQTSRRGSRRGIIPAHAGLTIMGTVKDGQWVDHPRACGAHSLLRSISDLTTGSSPRMRGSLSIMGVSTIPIGIIPAHAGLTSLRHALNLLRRDHPRACGAHCHGGDEGNAKQGSSPRMRGSQMMMGAGGVKRGIIPAHAGLTSLSSSARSASGDHPRACGAHRSGAKTSSSLSGSSPRMRGSPRPVSSSWPLPGIIPAHAGLTHRALV